MTNPTLQAELEQLLGDYSAEVADQFGGDTDKNPVVQSELDATLKAILATVSKHLPEKLEPKNLHLTYDNGGFMGNYCDTCKIFTFDKDTFEETGAWCLCYPRNTAIIEMEKRLGENNG